MSTVILKVSSTSGICADQEYRTAICVIAFHSEFESF